jgi:hypothetical protein
MGRAATRSRTLRVTAATCATTSVEASCCAAEQRLSDHIPTGNDRQLSDRSRAARLAHRARRACSASIASSTQPRVRCTAASCAPLPRSVLGLGLHKRILG